jgi:hypothetical protein
MVLGVQSTLPSALGRMNLFISSGNLLKFFLCSYFLSLWKYTYCDVDLPGPVLSFPTLQHFKVYLYLLESPHLCSFILLIF